MVEVSRWSRSRWAGSALALSMVLGGAVVLLPLGTTTAKEKKPRVVLSEDFGGKKAGARWDHETGLGLARVREGLLEVTARGGPFVSLGKRPPKKLGAEHDVVVSATIRMGKQLEPTSYALVWGAKDERVHNAVSIRSDGTFVVGSQQGAKFVKPDVWTAHAALKDLSIPVTIRVEQRGTRASVSFNGEAAWSGSLLAPQGGKVGVAVHKGKGQAFFDELRVERIKAPKASKRCKTLRKIAEATKGGVKAIQGKETEPGWFQPTIRLEGAIDATVAYQGINRRTYEPPAATWLMKSARDRATAWKAYQSITREVVTCFRGWYAFGNPRDLEAEAAPEHDESLEWTLSRTMESSVPGSQEIGVVWTPGGEDLDSEVLIAFRKVRRSQ